MEQTYDLQRSYVNVVVEHVVLGLAATVAVAFRFHARRLTKAKLGWDDWLSVVAAVFMWIDTALTSLEFRPSLQQARVTMPPDIHKINQLLILNWVSIFFVSGCQVFARLSVIMLYYRLFSVRRRLTYWLKGLGAISICWLIQMYIGTILACRPVKAIFDATVKGKCVDVQLAYVITNSVDTALDSAVLLLSIPVIMKLTLPTREKLGIASIFLAGGIVVATGLVRIVMAAKPEDQDLQSVSQTSLWNGLHLAFATISCCMPIFRIYLPRDSKAMASLASLFRSLKYWTTARGSRNTQSNSEEPSLPSFVHRPESMPGSMEKLPGRSFSGSKG